jgi:hypothetical protein
MLLRAHSCTSSGTGGAEADLDKEAPVRTRPLLVAALAASLLLGAARNADARPVHFMGPHPIAARFGGGFCYIETPHLHGYAPDHQALYQEVGGQFVFTADPTPFGYEGDKHTFYGHHPIITVEGGEPVYCFLDGPHFHPYAAPETAEYKMKDGVAFYVGPFAPSYARMKPHRVKVVNAEYRPYVELRPTVQVEPPPEWHGEVYISAPVPSVTVRTPGVYVDAPHPRASVEVYAPAPGIVVAPPAPHVVIGAPAPRVDVYAPAPHVMVAPPAPHVMIGAPAPTVVVGAPAPGVVVTGQVRMHHDNGRHEGWRKHGGRGDQGDQ